MEAPHRHKGFDLFIRLEIDQVDDCFAARGASRFRNLVHFEPIAASVVREEQYIGMGAGHKDILDKVVFLEVGGVEAAATSPLHSVSIYWQALYVSGMSDGDHHQFVGNQIFDVEAAAIVFEDSGTTGIAKLISDLPGFLFDQFHPELASGHQFSQTGDGDQQFLILRLDLVSLEPREAL